MKKIITLSSISIHLITGLIISSLLMSCSNDEFGDKLGDEMSTDTANETVRHSSDTSYRSANNDSQALSAFTQQSHAHVKLLAGDLKQALMSAMQSGGPQAAVNVCNMQASRITAELNSQQPLQIKRTSLKYRNPNNQPDAWERAVLEQFNQQAADGVAIQQMVHSEQVDVNGQTQFRYMRAIPVQAPCLACHGSEQQIPATVRATLVEHYPNDQATGYAIGDIRGAFSVWQSIE